MTVRGEAVRKAGLLGGSALALVLAASAAHAQCTSTSIANPFFRNVDYGTTSSGTNAAVQSLIGVLGSTNTAFLTQTTGFIGAPAGVAEGTNGGGAWVRGIGGTLDTRTTGNYTYGGNGFTAGGGGSCTSRTFQDYSGVQVGADISRLNINGANVHVGLTAGYTDSSVRSPTGNSTFRGDFQIPFVGLYGAVTKDGFFADGQVRADFYQSRLNDPTNGLFGQRLNAHAVSFAGNLGKQFPLADDWFVEPSIGGIYSMVKVDPLNIAGTIFLANSPYFGPPATIRINDFDSILGRASVRVGRNFILDNVALQPFVTASVFHEFSGQVRTSIVTGFDALGTATGFGAGTLAPLDNQAVLNSRRIGTYGQFAGGIAGQVLNTGWLGYVRGDYRIGDRVEGWGISAGLRYQFQPDPVVAAARNVVRKGYDMPATVVPAIEGPINWTGFSIGGHLGGTWGQTTQTDAFLGTVRPWSAGLLAGGQVGADYQFANNWVIGVSGDGSWVNAKGGRSCPGAGITFFFTCETQVDLLALGTGRIGYAVDRSLFYVKGGGAFAETTERTRDNTGGQPLIGGAGNFQSFRAPGSGFGWTVGAGVEYMITKNWSAKAEYMHYELERRRSNFPAAAGLVSTNEHTGNLVRVGVNYRFNFDPAPVVMPARAVVAKY